MEIRNRKKAEMLYDYLDKSDFYIGTADKDSRSLMNITFRLGSEELEKKFTSEATRNSLGGLKGHRSVGGCRASLYNAIEPESVKALIDFTRARGTAVGVMWCALARGRRADGARAGRGGALRAGFPRGAQERAHGVRVARREWPLSTSGPKITDFI